MLKERYNAYVYERCFHCSIVYICRRKAIAVPSAFTIQLTSKLAMAQVACTVSKVSAANQPVIATNPVCANTRYVFKCCVHLDKCQMHPQDVETLSCTCPDPRASFTTVIVEDECRKCKYRQLHREHAAGFKQLADKDAKIADLKRRLIESRLATISMSVTAKRRAKKLLACRCAVIDSMSKKLARDVQLADTELQLACSEIERKTIAVSHMDQIGTFVFDSILWFTGEEDDKLWTW